MPQHCACASTTICIHKQQNNNKITKLWLSTSLQHALKSPAVFPAASRCVSVFERAAELVSTAASDSVPSSSARLSWTTQSLPAVACSVKWSVSKSSVYLMRLTAKFTETRKHALTRHLICWNSLHWFCRSASILSRSFCDAKNKHSKNVSSNFGVLYMYVAA